MIRHAQLDCDHEHVIVRQVGFLERADFLNRAALKQADDFSAIVKVAGEPVELPSEDCICFAALDATNHLVENLATWLFGTLALGERVNDNEAVLSRDGIQFGKLRVNRKHLTIFILGGFARVNEVFKHGHSITKDISICENKMTHGLKNKLTKDALKLMRGGSSRERVLHRLHSVALVLSGLSASEAARIYGDSPRAVAYWVTRFSKHGIQGLEEEVRPGRPSRLNAAQWTKAQRFMNQLEKKGKPVNADALAAFLLAQFQINLTARQCSRILKRMRT